MKELNTKHEYDQFKESIFDLVSDYISESDVYPTDSILAINKITFEYKICSANELDENWDMYKLEPLQRPFEEGIGKEPDIDALMDLADNYFFVR